VRSARTGFFVPEEPASHRPTGYTSVQRILHEAESDLDARIHAVYDQTERMLRAQYVSHTDVHSRRHLYVYVHMDADIHTYTYIHIHTHTYTYIHRCSIYSFIHTYIRLRLLTAAFARKKPYEKRLGSRQCQSRYTKNGMNRPRCASVYFRLHRHKRCE
jgi:hypothetical protein